MTATPKQTRRRWMRWVAGGCGLLLLVLLVDYFAYPQVAQVGGHSGNQGANGLWLRYRWYFGEKSDVEISTLGDRLQKDQIRYAYFHVRFIQSDGRLHFRYPQEARRLTALLHAQAPEVKLLAWVYVGNEREQPPVDLGNPTVRARVVQEAVWLVKTCGFDGIQWDYEICANNDERLISLLKDSRAALPPDTPISVCTPTWYFWPVTAVYGWDEAFFARVAAECDQLAVMDYDTGMFLPRSYVWFTRQQVIHVTRAAARGNSRCQVIIGVPTYAKGGAVSHSAHAETLRLALKGVREGVASSQATPSTFTGIAPFADYTTQPKEWGEYRAYWLGE